MPTAERLAAALDDSPGEIAVCSTGLIGERLPMDRLLPAVDAAVAEADRSGGVHAADAIRTTDTIIKIAFRRVTALPNEGVWTIGGMAKGAGMLAPSLATMLVVLTTDADLTPAELDSALRSATAVTFDRLDSDGCMSTNDTVLLMASAASGVKPDHRDFTRAPDRGLRRPRPPAPAQRRGRLQVRHDRGRRRRQRSRRAHRGPLGGKEQPAQVRARGRGPELGPGPVRGPARPTPSSSRTASTWP